MAYYFMVETKKGNYKSIDITKSKYFSKISNFKKPDACSLQEIDMFTMMFNDEKELRKTLLEEKLILPEDVGKKLSARIINKSKCKKVEYDFLYQKDIEFIGCPELVIKRINSELMRDNFDFIEKLAAHYRNFYDCSSTAPEVVEFAKSSKLFGVASKHFYDLDKNGDNAVVRLAKLIIYDYYEMEDGYIKYKETVKYKNLHDVVAFINNYEKNKQKNENQEENTTSVIENTSNMTTSEIINEVVEQNVFAEYEQLDMFDIMDSHEKEDDPDRYIFEDEPEFSMNIAELDSKELQYRRKYLKKEL